MLIKAAYLVSCVLDFNILVPVSSTTRSKKILIMTLPFPIQFNQFSHFAPFTLELIILYSFAFHMHFVPTFPQKNVY